MGSVTPQQCESYGKGVSGMVCEKAYGKRADPCDGRTLMAGCVLVESLLFSPGMLPADLPSHL